MVVAPGRMIDSFLSIPDAESLPLYRMVLKLACVCVADIVTMAWSQPTTNLQDCGRFEKI